MDAVGRKSRLCEACSAIFGGEAAGTTDEDFDTDIDFDHHKTLVDLREAVARKCPLCRRFFELLAKEAGGDFDQVEKHVDSSDYATSITLSPYNRSMTIQVELNLLRSSGRYVGAMMHLYPWDGELSAHPSVPSTALHATLEF